MNGRLRQAAALAAVLVALGGCVANRMDTTRLEQVALAADARVAIIGRRHSQAPETETSLIGCVERRLRKHGIASIGGEALSDTLYPWLEPRRAPLEPGALEAMLEDAAVAARVAELGVRYWIWLEGVTTSEDRRGTMTCAVGPATGCIGFGIWSRTGSYEAVIWDIEQRQELGRISSTARGTSVMPAVVVPLPFLARSQAAACRGIARQLTHLFSGPPEPKPSDAASDAAADQ